MTFPKKGTKKYKEMMRKREETRQRNLALRHPEVAHLTPATAPQQTAECADATVRVERELTAYQELDELTRLAGAVRQMRTSLLQIENHLDTALREFSKRAAGG